MQWWYQIYTTRRSLSQTIWSLHQKVVYFLFQKLCSLDTNCTAVWEMQSGIQIYTRSSSLTVWSLHQKVVYKTCLNFEKVVWIKFSQLFFYMYKKEILLGAQILPHHKKGNKSEMSVWIWAGFPTGLHSKMVRTNFFPLNYLNTQIP